MTGMKFKDSLMRVGRERAGMDAQPEKTLDTILTTMGPIEALELLTAIVSGPRADGGGVLAVHYLISLASEIHLRARVAELEEEVARLRAEAGPFDLEGGR